MTINALTPVTAPTVGKTVKLTTNQQAQVTGTLDSTLLPASKIMIKNGGTNAAGGDPGTGVLAFVRVSGEPANSIIVTSADIPLLPGERMIILNPVPNGKTGLAVTSSGTTNVDIFFTPVEGDQA